MNPWDKLSDYFDTQKPEGDIDPGVADNILIAWPALFEGIGKIQPSGNGLSALDFGCGAGSFSGALHRRGYHVVAADTSPELLRIARKHADPSIAFHQASHETVALLKGAPFDLVTSVMVLQFIPDVVKALDDLDKALRPEGVMALAVFNPAYVQINTGPERDYKELSKPFIATRNFMCIKGTDVPVYLRTEREYHALLKARGYARILTKRPRFTRAFLNQYPKTTDTRFSEYMVMVYQKNGGKSVAIPS